MVSCGEKKSDPQAQTQAATLSGQIQPAGSVATVTATDSNGRIYTTTPTSIGTYSFASLPVGFYTLSITPTAGYVAPAPVSITLASTGTTAGSITLLTQMATLSGQIQPAGSVATVTAISSSGQPYTATPTATGTYSFPNLPLGAYTLSFMPVAGYAVPAAVAVTLISGGSTVPVIRVAVGQRAVSFQVDGQPVVSPYIYGSSVGGTLYYGFNYGVPGTGVPDLRLNLDILVPVVGTYSLNDPNTNYRGSYTNIQYTSYSSKFNNPAGSTSGTLTITSVNPTLRLFSGTFQFLVGDPRGSALNGNLPSGTPPIVRITNGTFNNLFY